MSIQLAVADKIIELLSAKEGWEEDPSSPIKGHFKKLGCDLSFVCGNFRLSETERYFVNADGSPIPLRFDEENARRIRVQFDVLLAHIQEVQKAKVTQESLSAMENAFSVLCKNPSEP